jgi:hypothetical protein
MMRSLAISIVAASLLGGCGTVVPQFDVPHQPDGLPTVYTIVERVRCELGEVALEAPGANLLVLADVSVAVQLNLDVNDSGGLAPTFTYMKGPFSFGAGFTLSQSREQSFNEMLHFTMKEVAAEFPNRETLDSKCKLGYNNLEGRLGIKESVDLAGTASNIDLAAPGTGTSGVFGGLVQFIVTKNLTGVGPTWTLTNFTGPGKFASASDVSTNKIVFAFAFPAKPGEKKSTTAGKADKFVDSVQTNHLTTQLGSINRALQ